MRGSCSGFNCATGDWETVYIPFREFVPVVRAKYDPTAPALNPATVRQMGFRLSRFDFNSLANPRFRPSRFSLEVACARFPPWQHACAS